MTKHKSPKTSKRKRSEKSTEQLTSQHPGEWEPVPKVSRTSHPQNAGSSQLSLSFGMDWKRSPKFNIAKAHDDGFRNNFNFVCIPLSTDGEEKAEEIHLDHSLTSRENFEYFSGKTADWISFAPGKEEQHEKFFNQEISWAVHLGAHYVILSPAAVRNSSRLIAVLVNAVTVYKNISVIVPCDLTSDGWKHWNVIRNGCAHHARIIPAVIVGEDLPARPVIDRWFGESIHCFFISADLLLTDVNGKLQLPVAHGDVLYRFWSTNTPSSTIITELQENELNPFKAICAMKDVSALRSHQLNENEVFEKHYYDVLQHPLQPLMDNLSWSTYQTFERDVVKYDMYEKAITLRLKDLKGAGRTEPVILMVCGAGRGPLVDRAIASSKATGVPLKLWVVEKNPNAVVTLQHYKKTKWKLNDLVKEVTLVHTDMREFNPGEKADIIVSELLGSFGDNELSPECLDGVEKLIAEDGISIPCDYTSYLAPISTTRLHREIMGNLKNCETPYVVRLHNHTRLAPPVEVWKFRHPNPNPKGEYRNAKTAVLEFEPTKMDYVCHGLVGFFHATLYKDVCISTEPSTATPEMYSWFPIWFPLVEPISVMKGEVISTSMWRRVTRSKIWYEWMITAPRPTKLHNPGGRSYWVGL